MAMLAFSMTIGTSAGLAQPLSVDWKLYGFSSNEGKDVDECFYDVKGITRGNDNHCGSGQNAFCNKTWTRSTSKATLTGELLITPLEKQLMATYRQLRQ